MLATEFHLIHALAMLGAGIVAQLGGRLGNMSAGVFQVGILGFCASLYYRATEGAGSLGSLHWITPIGGFSLMIGWGLLVFAALQLNSRRIFS